MSYTSDPVSPIGSQFSSRLPDRRDAQDLLNSISQRARFRLDSSTAEPVVLYGAGELGQMANAWCRQHGVVVLGVVDTRADKWRGNPVWSGEKIWAPDEAPEAIKADRRILICISTLPLVEIQTALRSSGWSRLQHFYDFVEAWPEPHSLRNGWSSSIPRHEGLKQTAYVLDGWCDDISRAHHLQFISWRCLREEWSFQNAPIHSNQRYRIPEFLSTWKYGERILDGGAHHGQLLKNYIELHPGGFSRAWVVEPDRINREKLKIWKRTLEPDLASRLDIYEFALDKRNGIRSFIDQQGYASKLWGGGNVKIETRSVDSMALSPTMIKFHLEGGEWRALQGAVDTIVTHHPLLVITVYHRRDGIYLLPYWLMTKLPHYEWRFRLHGWVGTAAVIYGIPSERL